MMTRNMSTFVSSSLVLGHAGRTAGSDSLCISTDLPAKLPRNASRCSGNDLEGYPLRSLLNLSLGWLGKLAHRIPSRVAERFRWRGLRRPPHLMTRARCSIRDAEVWSKVVSQTRFKRRGQVVWPNSMGITWLLLVRSASDRGKSLHSACKHKGSTGSSPYTGQADARSAVLLTAYGSKGTKGGTAA